MNREEAKYILRAYRASGDDNADPEFQEALELARQDAELARWFAEEQSLDVQIARKLGAFPVSPRIKRELLTQRKIVRPALWRRTTVQIAAAAAVAAVVIAIISVAFLSISRRKASATLADFRQTMARASLDMASHLDVMGLSAAELGTWIANHGGSAEFELPSGLRGFPVAGCKVLDWQGHKVTLLCFKPGGGHFDVFVMNETDLPGRLLNATAQFASVNGATTAAWRHGGKIYLLASTSSKSDLAKLL